MVSKSEANRENYQKNKSGEIETFTQLVSTLHPPLHDSSKLIVCSFGLQFYSVGKFVIFFETLKRKGNY